MDDYGLDNYDSNKLILPGNKKRKDRNKEYEKSQMNKQPKLSKSQKRKMKKLEEEKQNAAMLSKSLETLKKCSIPDEVFPLLRSIRDIGKDETRLEKRSRDVQLLKVGIEPSRIDKHQKKYVDFNQIHDSEVDSVHPMMLKGDVQDDTYFSAESSPSPDNINLHGGSDIALSADGDGNIVQADKTESAPFLCPNGIARRDRSMDGVEEGPKVNPVKTTSNLQELPFQRPLFAPTVVHVSRPKDIDDKRKDLPIVMMEQEIVEAINENDTVIICGETGCGKTTQVPQFLYEAGFGSNKSGIRGGIIGVTQPRRVAVLATAKRVAYELGLHLGKEVGFQVRYDKKIGESCSIKFMTDGILLREVQNDFLLKRYSVIILDEAHERSLNTDILIGMLSRVVKLRQELNRKQQQLLNSGQSVAPEKMISPLKLILMSATLRVEDFSSGGRLFGVPPPVIEVPTRQYPVTVHFSKRTEIVDYIGQAYKKLMGIHKMLPSGGILVFVTGQREVEYLCRKLRDASRKLISKASESNAVNHCSTVSETDPIQGKHMKEISEAFESEGDSVEKFTDRFSSYDDDDDDADKFNTDDDIADDSFDSETESELEFINDDPDPLIEEYNPENVSNLSDVFGESGSLVSLKQAFEALAGNTGLSPKSTMDQVNPDCSKICSDITNPDKHNKENGEAGFNIGALHVLPLYAMLPAASQLRVFEEVKEGDRLVVVATNVAETSLTIPGIKYVVDTGRQKVKLYNSSSGIESYEIQWISKASAAQRAGRAGRTGPGHCYRLYSSAVFSNILPDFSLAEIAKVPVDGVVLLMKSMGIDKVVNFPFPTPPETSAVVEAEQCLKALETLDNNGRLTALGKSMARYPMSPRHSRMLLTVIQIMRNLKNYSRANLVLAYAVAAAAALSLPNPFLILFEGTKAKEDDLENDVGGKKVVDKEEEIRKKKAKDLGKAAREKYLNPSSDALTIAYALQSYELSESLEQFCKNNALHHKTMEEMSKLRRQLLQLVFNTSVVSNMEQDFTWNHGNLQDIENAWKVSSGKHPLLLNEEEILGQAICAGWADKVAKRVRGTSHANEGNQKTIAIRYQACMVKENVFIHRWSSVSRSAPDFLVYSELLLTKRPFMHGVTSVKPNWLVNYATSLCTFSAPLTDPKPYYDPQTDQVYSWVSPTFGCHLWELPLHSLPVKDSLQQLVVFAYALLEGQVLPCLKSVSKFMAGPPTSVLRPEAMGQKRVGNLVHKLKVKSINSCAMLRAVWKEHPYELHSEIMDWFQENFKKNFEELWRQVHLEVDLEPSERFPKNSKKHKRKTTSTG